MVAGTDLTRPTFIVIFLLFSLVLLLLIKILLLGQVFLLLLLVFGFLLGHLRCSLCCSLFTHSVGWGGLSSSENISKVSLMVAVLEVGFVQLVGSVVECFSSHVLGLDWSWG